MASGMTIHATTINTSHVFSHFQRDCSFIGAVKRPLHAPESTANTMPLYFIVSA